MKMTELTGDENKGYKLRLYPNKKQRKILFEYFGMSKFIYNKCIDIQEKVNDKIEYYDMVKVFTKMKNEENEYKWLDSYNAESVRGAIMDYDKACKNHKKEPKRYGKPLYKNKNSKKQFYTTPSRLSIIDDCVKLSSIGKIKYCNSYGDEIIGTGNKYKTRMKYIHYYNPRVSYDGLNFYLSFTIPKDQYHQVNSYWNNFNSEEWQEQESSESLVLMLVLGMKNG